MRQQHCQLATQTEMGTSGAKQRLDSPWPGLAASALSTIVSRTATYPADTLKARLQVQGALAGPLAYRNTLHAFRKVVALEGLRGLYKGFGAVLAGVLPATMLYFWSYETAKKVVPPRYGAAGDFTVGAIAQLTAGVIFTPVDIIKERLQVQRMMKSPETSARQAVTKLIRESGLKGLMQGYWITNSIWIPWTSFYIAFYESAKRASARRLSLEGPEQLPAWAFAACSGGAAAAAALLTHPLDVVKTRLQVLSASPEMQRLTAVSIARDLWQKEGIIGFTHGCTARMLQIAPGAAISWLLYESIKLRLQQLRATDSN